MGAGDWVAGGLRRAAAGVRSFLPWVSEPIEEPSAQAVSVPAAARSAKVPPAKNPASAPARTVPAGTASSLSGRGPRGRPGGIVGNTPARPRAVWSDEELAHFRAALDADVVRLREELDKGQADMDALLSDAAERAGDDQADAGSKTLDREQEMSVNANAQELLEQSMHALARLDAGTYGNCEVCGRAIPAARLRAFPRATLCIPCKQAEERR